MIYDRDQLMRLEDSVLSSYAAKSKLSRGREHAEKQDSTRTPFQKDRDRIIHCRAFRRLKMKTQVFVAHYGDHYRTRLTHSLEAAQISRDVARSLGLNEDLAETIALAHDLGHTPFGHAGEETLDELLRPFGVRFEHNAQSRRILEELEQVYPDFPGLNLTFEVRQGLMKHQTPWDQNDCNFQGASLEAQVVNLADEIAYLNHDVDDALRAGLLTEERLGELAIWRTIKEDVKEQYGDISNKPIRRARMVSKMIGLMIQDLIATSAQILETQKIQSLEDVYKSKKELIQFSAKQKEWNSELNDFLMKNMYMNSRVLDLSKRGQQIIKELFATYHENPDKLPKEEQEALQKGTALEILIKDYIAGMTDEFAEQEWERLVG